MRIESDFPVIGSVAIITKREGCFRLRLYRPDAARFTCFLLPQMRIDDIKTNHNYTAQ